MQNSEYVDEYQKGGCTAFYVFNIVCNGTTTSE